MKEIYFNKGIIPMLIDTFQKNAYKDDIKCFLKFLKILKAVARENKLYRASSEAQDFVYAFTSHTLGAFIVNSVATVESVQSALRLLLDIAVDTDFDAKRNDLSIRELKAMNEYFKVLVKCFKKWPLDSNRELCSYVTVPLKTLQNSFVSSYLLAKMEVQELLMRILKRASDIEFQVAISGFVGRISSIHITSRCMKLILKRFIKESKHVSQGYKEKYFEFLVNTLISTITGDSIKNLYFFPGDSFIKLETPLRNTATGLFFVASIRCETRNLQKSQCIFSLLEVNGNRVKGVELFINDGKLVYTLLNVGRANNSLIMTIPDIEIVEDRWHRIVVAHIGTSLHIFASNFHFKNDVDNQAFPKEYNFATIGASMDVERKKYRAFFFGEMSAVYFFSPAGRCREYLESPHFREELFRIDELGSDSLKNTSAKNEAKNHCKELLAAPYVVIDPKVELVLMDRLTFWVKKWWDKRGKWFHLLPR